MAITKGSFSAFALDDKTVHIFAYSSTREQSNKRSGTRLKTESETGESRLFFFSLSSHAHRACEARARLLRHVLPISLLTVLRKTKQENTTVLQSTFISVNCFLNISVELKHETLDV